MVDSSSNDLTQLINQQLEFQEPLGENITKAKALVHIALECKLLQYSPDIIYYYFWSISDFLEKAAEIHEAALNNLVKQQRVNWQG